MTMDYNFIVWQDLLRMGESRPVRIGHCKFVGWSQPALRTPRGHLESRLFCTQLSHQRRQASLVQCGPRLVVSAYLVHTETCSRLRPLCTAQLALPGMCQDIFLVFRIGPVHSSFVLGPTFIVITGALILGWAQQS